MRLVILSDTHGLHGLVPSIPAGDVLIHAGDMAGRGAMTEVAECFQWYQALPHVHKIVIAGNHDWGFERQPMLAEEIVPAGVHYLRDAGVTIDGVRFWGVAVAAVVYELRVQSPPRTGDRGEMGDDPRGHTCADHPRPTARYS